MSFWFLPLRVMPLRSCETSIFLRTSCAFSGGRPDNSPFREGFISRRDLRESPDRLAAGLEGSVGASAGFSPPLSAETSLDLLDLFFFFFCFDDVDVEGSWVPSAASSTG